MGGGVARCCTPNGATGWGGGSPTPGWPGNGEVMAGPMDGVERRDVGGLATTGVSFQFGMFVAFDGGGIDGEALKDLGGGGGAP
jgi:hypothetical protein